MRPVVKESSTRADGAVRTYKKHTDAKPELIANLGCYCSYCEIWSQQSHLEVEHLYHKKGYPEKSLSWDNFLLSCKNCNTTKGTKDLAIAEVYLPHQANTFRMISVLEGGIITVNPALINTAMKAKAQRSIELTGQDKVPGSVGYSAKDDRWQHRKTAWDLASDFLKKWECGSTTVKDILKVATQRGFWSIWMVVFKDHPQVREAFLKDTAHFKGTATFCFDANGNPINRNGADL